MEKVAQLTFLTRCLCRANYFNVSVKFTFSNFFFNNMFFKGFGFFQRALDLGFFFQSELFSQF